MVEFPGTDVWSLSPCQFPVITSGAENPCPLGESVPIYFCRLCLISAKKKEDISMRVCLLVRVPGTVIY